MFVLLESAVQITYFFITSFFNTLTSNGSTTKQILDLPYPNHHTNLISPSKLQDLIFKPPIKKNNKLFQYTNICQEINKSREGNNFS